MSQEFKTKKDELLHKIEIFDAAIANDRNPTNTAKFKAGKAKIEKELAELEAEAKPKENMESKAKKSSRKKKSATKKEPKPVMPKAEKPKREKHHVLKSDTMTIGGKQYNLNAGDECKAAIKALVAIKEQRSSSSAEAKAKPVSEKIGHAVEVLTNHALENVAAKVENNPAELKKAASQLERAIKALSAALVKITGSKGLPKQIEDSLKAIAEFVKDNAK